MTKLKCDFDSFKLLKEDIKSKVEDYGKITKSLISLQNENIWKSDAQKALYSKFIERKKDLELLYNDYSEMISLLNDIITTYENIENSY